MVKKTEAPGSPWQMENSTSWSGKRLWSIKQAPAWLWRVVTHCLDSTEAHGLQYMVKPLKGHTVIDMEEIQTE